MERLVEVRDLKFGYGGKPVLKDVSFSIYKGDYTGISGGNGTGKSTLLKLMLGILPPASGGIFLFGESIQRFKQWNRVGYISQRATSFNQGFPATVEEIVGANLFSRIGLFKPPGRKHKEMVYQVLEAVGMQDLRKKLIGNLSGGQQQRVFIAKVLVSQPEILFLDEPTTGIDVKSEETVYCLLDRLNRESGLTVVMVSHDISALTVHASKLLCIGEEGLLEHECKNCRRGAV